MSSILCITFRFIQPLPLFHGAGDGGVPEWPPSPMRAFQALLNAASLLSRGRPLAPEVRSALQALETLRPQIVAPPAKASAVGYRAYVPHNQTDLVSAAWHRGNFEASVASHRMEKDIRPVRIETHNGELPTLHYLYSLDTTTLDPGKLLRNVRPSVRAITHLGWGIDQVAADVMLIESSTHFSGERWLPSTQGGRHLPVHRSGSLDALTNRYAQFLDRLRDGWTPVPPLVAVDQVRYRRDTDSVARPYAVFKLVDENEDAFRYPHAKLIHIAGMTRHAAIERMKADRPVWIDSPADWINRTVRGKRDEALENGHRQFSYIPLPSIGHEHADAMIRNVMIVAPLGMERELEYLAERLDGVLLTPEGDAGICDSDSKPSLAQRIELQHFHPPARRFIANCYLSTSKTWHTVTPVILDGHTKKSKSDKPEAIARETAKLICKALTRAGIETSCEFTWQAVPFLKNCLSAHKYDRHGRHTGYHRPSHLKDLTGVHVRLVFASPVPGPITLGAGRHCGLGLFAAAD
jgi:CRISPR-associated protein Csb2